MTQTGTKLRPTRGSGPLESFLAKKRAARANSLIPDTLRSGRILDIGCGQTPWFLITTEFREKVGLEKRPAYAHAEAGIETVVFDVDHAPNLPFKSNSFDVVTMLAVVEHLEPDNLRRLIDEIHRTLKPEGKLIFTTPPRWTEPILAALAKLGLVSSEEIDEHKETYTHSSLARVFESTRFGVANLRLGYFELFMNIWALAGKVTQPPSATCR